MERPSRTTLMLIAGVAALLLLILAYAATRDTDQDKLGAAPSDSVEADPDLTKNCSGQLVYDQIKRALFRQAARARAGESGSYERIAQAASVRMENPVAEGQDEAGVVVDCAGSLSIDLPPGITTVAGRHYLMSDVYYGVDPGSGGAARKVVQLRNANALIDSLATLTLGAPRSPPPPVREMPAPVEQDEALEPVAPIDPVRPSPPPAASALPSYDCTRARTRSEKAVCADPALASLDRAMASEYRRALEASSPAQAANLRQTRDRFLAYRDNCPNSACIAESYTGRIREIRDISAGRWRPR